MSTAACYRYGSRQIDEMWGSSAGHLFHGDDWVGSVLLANEGSWETDEGSGKSLMSFPWESSNLAHYQSEVVCRFSEFDDICSVV